MHRGDLKTEQLATFMRNQETLLEKKLRTDVFLECKGGVIEAHKLILSLASDYFHEKISGILQKTIHFNEFKYLEYRAVNAVVKFLYTGLLKNELLDEVHILRDMCCMASMIEHPLLVDFCWNLFARHIGQHNCFEMMEMAEQYGRVEIELDASRLIVFVLRTRNSLPKEEDLNCVSANCMRKILPEVIEMEEEKVLRIMNAWYDAADVEDVEKADVMGEFHIALAEHRNRLENPPPRPLQDDPPRRLRYADRPRL